MPTEQIEAAPPRNPLGATHIGVATQVDPRVRAAAIERAARESLRLERDIKLAQVLREGLTHLYNIGWFELGETTTES